MNGRGNTAGSIEFRVIDTGEYPIRVDARERRGTGGAVGPWHLVGTAIDDEHAERLIGRHAMQIVRSTR